MKQTWISVDDKMPEIIPRRGRSEKVLVAICTSEGNCIRRWNRDLELDYCYRRNGVVSFKNPDIKYWMPLPMTPWEQEFYKSQNRGTSNE